MTKAEARTVLMQLAAAFPDQCANPDTATVYADALADLDFELVDQAVKSLILTSTKYMPRIAEIRERCVELRDGGKRTGLEAWGSVLKAMRSQGSHRTPGKDFYFHDPITALVVASLGWSELCGGDADNQMSNRARFIEAYDQISRDDARAKQSGGLLPARVSTQRQLCGDDPATPIAKLLPRQARNPWEE